ncbi:MAPEG family protein [Profundibacter amoris]|uniref:MAPEG family protein n=1 Tax=Profundibacter amoris TaxID=2171755 RepID=A0A347UJJ7_9RHOB|nr:MAPEG family protein [Profundibacter amoris]AXX99025.1 MAPEG family protein [Profundibacter amoris]
MTPELTILTYAALLQAVQLALAILFGDAQTGIKYGASARDTPKPLTGLAGRVDRALNNHYAALALFTIAVIVVTLGNQSTPLTITCAWTYLIARILYVPAYLSGIPYLRSLIWSVGIGATVIMLIMALI